MNLPDFNQDGGSSQGVGGVSPEAAALARGDAGALDENSPEAQAVLKREAEDLAARMGGQEPERAAPEPAAPAAEKAPEQEAQRPAAETAEGEPTHDDDIDPEQLRSIRSKFRGKFRELSSDYVRKDHELQEKDRELAGMNRKLSELQAQVGAAVAQIGSRIAPPQEKVQSPQPPAYEIPQIDRDAYDADPIGSTAKIVDAVVRSHNAAMMEALSSRERERDANERIKSYKDRIEEYRTEINRLYQKDPDFWESMDRAKATEKMLEMAELERRASMGDDLWSQIERSGFRPSAEAGAGNGSQARQSGAVPYAELAASRRAGGRRAPGSSNAPQDWGRTEAMNRLRNSKMDSSDETLSIAEALKERGHWQTG